MIDDGTLVKKGQAIMVYSSALEDSYQAQRIQVDKTGRLELQSRTTRSTRHSKRVKKARSDINSRANLERYVGLPRRTLTGYKRDTSRMLLLELEGDLSLSSPAIGTTSRMRTEYQKTVGDWVGQIGWRMPTWRCGRIDSLIHNGCNLRVISPLLKFRPTNLVFLGRGRKKSDPRSSSCEIHCTAHSQDFSSKVQEAWRILDRT